MATKLSIGNFKGGVGKTATTTSIGQGLARADYKVLGIDLDPQESFRDFNSFLEETKYNIRDLFLKALNKEPITREMVLEAITPTAIPNLYAMPCCPEHKETHIDIRVIKEDIPQKEGTPPIKKDTPEEEYRKSTLLRDILSLIEDDFDLIIMDNRPTSDAVTFNSLTAADYVIGPVEADNASYKASSELLTEIHKAKQFNPDLELLGILLTRVDKNSAIYHSIRESLSEDFGDVLFDTSISSETVMKEWGAQLLPPFTQGHRGDVLRDYITLIYEMGLLEYEKYMELIMEYGKIKKISLTNIDLHDNYPRKEILKLAKDIRENGQKEPIIVKKYMRGCYNIIHGGKRYAALKYNAELEEKEEHKKVGKNNIYKPKKKYAKVIEIERVKQED